MNARRNTCGGSARRETPGAGQSRHLRAGRGEPRRQTPGCPAASATLARRVEWVQVRDRGSGSFDPSAQHGHVCTVPEPTIGGVLPAARRPCCDAHNEFASRRQHGEMTCGDSLGATPARRVVTVTQSSLAQLEACQPGLWPESRGVKRTRAARAGAGPARRNERPMATVYVDISRHLCAWLTELIRHSRLPSGDVLCRDIRQMTASDLADYRQVHLFAGIGGWAFALKLAGWPAHIPVWTGSCPCQPFSGAGRQKGFTDARHLWPHMLRLVDQCRPPVVFGEQVASPAGREWMSRVRSDLEALGYAVGAADLCAASVGAPHIRQRLFWVGIAWRDRLERLISQGPAPAPTFRACSVCRLGNTDRKDGRLLLLPRESSEENTEPVGPGESNCVADYWRHCCFVSCADGRVRRIESGISPLAHGVPARMVRLRGYGNAIVPQLAAAFVIATLDVITGAKSNERK